MKMIIYALVDPIYNNPRSVYTGIFELGISFFHAYVDEKVCGFSLTKDVQFLYSQEELEEAIVDINCSAAIPLRSARALSGKAIIELECDETQIQQFISITRIDDSGQWVSKKIEAADLTPRALEQINIKYKNSNRDFHDLSADHGVSFQQ